MPHYKATFVRKYYGHGYDAHMVYLDYTYRGHEYTVYENRAKGNEPLAWQHRSEQNRIDLLIEMEEREKNREAKPCHTVDYVFDQFLRYCEGEPFDHDIINPPA